MSCGKVNSLYKLGSIYLKFPIIALFYFAIAANSNSAFGSDNEFPAAAEGSPIRLSSPLGISIPMPVDSNTDNLQDSIEAARQIPKTSKQQPIAQEITPDSNSSSYDQDLLNDLDEIDQEIEQEELLETINRAPAEAAFNTIIDFVESCDVTLDSSNEAAIKKFSSHLLRDVYGILQEGVLNIFLGNQTQRIEKLQKVVKKLKNIIERFQKQNKEIRNKWLETVKLMDRYILQKPKELAKIQTLEMRVSALTKENGALKKVNKLQKVYIGILLIPTTVMAVYGGYNLIKKLLHHH